MAAALLAFGLVVYADDVNLTTYLRTRNPVENNGRVGKEHLLEDENVNLRQRCAAQQPIGRQRLGDHPLELRDESGRGDVLFDPVSQRSRATVCQAVSRSCEPPFDPRLRRAPSDA